VIHSNYFRNFIQIDAQHGGGTSPVEREQPGRLAGSEGAGSEITCGRRVPAGAWRGEDGHGAANTVRGPARGPACGSQTRAVVVHRQASMEIGKLYIWHEVGHTRIRSSLIYEGYNCIVVDKGWPRLRPPFSLDRLFVLS
jgi:hypothetical protein